MLLRQYLQTYHWLARRNFTHLIDLGEIFINGEKVENYKTTIKNWDQISIKNLKIYKTIQLRVAKTQSNFILFNKPVGYVVSKADPHNKTIYTLLPKHLHHYYYIWRLDKESRGLLLLTDTPKLVHLFEHPSNEIHKTYLLELHRPFDINNKKNLLQGIKDDKDLLKAIKIQILEKNVVQVTLNEGKKRHLRRMFAALEYQILDLQRIQVGNYQLGNIKEGERITQIYSW